MFDEIRNSYPTISGQLSAEKLEILAELPDDYRSFLRVHNGGFVDEFRYSFQTGVPFKTKDVENPSRSDCPVEFFGIPAGQVSGSYPEDLLQVAVDHAAEEFLPENVIAVARCIQSSLVCISVRSEDYGAIYYWDWYWRYPWCVHFFDARIEKVQRNYRDAAAILNDREHPHFTTLRDELNYATLTRIAPSFSDWFAMCEDVREVADE